MNVTCVRCGTEYDFDDALVSERGTTVRCTRCTFEFRVRSPRSPERPPERWIVRKSSGEEYDFVSLTDLQQAIHLRRVSPQDELSRDGHTFRLFADAEEFEAFFEPSQRRVRTRAGALHTQGGTAGGRVSVPPPNHLSGHLPPVGRAAPDVVSAPRAITRGELSDPSHGAFAHDPSVHDPSVHDPMALPPVTHGVPERGYDARANFGRGHEADAGSRGFEAAPDEADLGDEWGDEDEQSLSNPAAQLLSSPDFSPAPGLTSPGESLAGGPATRRRRARVQYASSPQPVEPRPDAPRPDASRSNPRRSIPVNPLPPSIPPPSRAGGGVRWMGALVLLGGGALLAGTVGRRYFNQFIETRPAVVVSDTRSKEWIAHGHELLRAGDLEGAKAEFDKASALTEKEPEALTGLLQVELVQADALWLKIRLLGDADAAPRSQLEGRLAARFAKLRSAVEALIAVAAQRSDAQWSIADALRIQGDLPAARKHLEGGLEPGSEPDVAYVLAMLDAADTHPSWPAIVARLNNAALAERGLGRAHVALIYALGASGEFAVARQQLASFAGQTEHQAMFDMLQAYVNRLNPEPAGTQKAVESPVAPQPTTHAVGEAVVAAATPGDAIAQAQLARSSGDWQRAGRFYTLALSGSPGNIEAMTGLGDVALAEGRSAVAASHYSAALRQDANYTPALRALGDLRWAAGDRGSAVELYRRLPAGYGSPIVAQRLAEFDAQPGSVAPASSVVPGNFPPSGAATAAPGVPHNAETRPVSPEPNRSPGSEVDTSDLPEYN